MICLFLGAVLCGGTAAAQHTLGVTGGYGYGNARFYPKEETRVVWGCYTAGVTWRYYGPQRFVGGFGIDFEYLQRGFSFLQNPTEEDPAKYQWYTRRVKSLRLPDDRQHDGIDMPRIVEIILLLLDLRSVGRKRKALLLELQINAEAPHEALLAVVAPRKAPAVKSPDRPHLLLGLEAAVAHAVAHREAERMLRRSPLPCG